MKIEIEQKMSEDYFRELYDEMVNYRLKYRKWQIPISVLLILLAIPICFVDEKSYFFSVGILVFALMLAIDYFSEKRKWLKNRLASKMNGEMSILSFNEDGFFSKSLYSTSNGSWNSFTETVETPKGIFLVVDKGMSIYLQKENFKNIAEIEFIRQKVKLANQ